MQTIIEALREIIGTPEFYVQMGLNSSYTWDYGAIIEYCFAGLIVCIVIASALKFLVNFIK